MSKMDELRALREARYERTVSRSAVNRADPAKGPTRAEPTRPGSLAAETPEAETPEAENPEAGSEARLCGHRAISGRTCTREHGHAAKSHRYA